jgi:hypothetical protein
MQQGSSPTLGPRHINAVSFCSVRAVSDERKLISIDTILNEVVGLYTATVTTTVE